MRRGIAEDVEDHFAETHVVGIAVRQDIQFERQVVQLGMLGVSVNLQDPNVLYLGYTYDAFRSNDRALTWR